jgi:tungstate transport system permease protein
MHDFLEIVGLSISVSLAATVLAAAVSMPTGAALAIFPFRGRRLVVVLINAFFGLPPVVVGLVLYLALSRSGSLGFLELLFTPAAMVIAQTILAMPIITALVHRASERAWARYGDELITDGATRLQAGPQILMIIRAELLTAVLAGFGRTVSEVGAVILVGGNIRGLTRTMTTAIALQTSQGDLSLALALGGVLVGISISISATVLHWPDAREQRGVTKYNEISEPIGASREPRYNECEFCRRAIHRVGLDNFGGSIRANGEHTSAVHGPDRHHSERRRAGHGQSLGHCATGRRRSLAGS